MIRSFEIKQPDKTHIEWLAKVPALAKPRKFEFKPGLNILWGPNGSGKSTLIKAMARLFHCEQGGVPVVTQTSVDTLAERFRKDEGQMRVLTQAVKLDHDGQAVRYFDPSNAVGLTAGGAAFDWDFTVQGIASMMFKGSSGQTTMHRVNTLIGEILHGKVPTIERKMRADTVNDLWGQRIKVAEEFLKGSGEKGPLTVLLDEPERSFDFPSQVSIWRFIRAFAPTTQFIVASHSFFALRLPEANYIEMDPGYLAQSEMAYALLGKGWSEEKPKPPPARNLARARKGK